MFRLRTFGGLSLADGGPSDIAIQRRRLAVLALLASAGSRGLTRDKLIAFLWPESSSDDARHSLEQLLYSLRRQLGTHVFVGTDPLHLNADIVSSDIAAFDDALSREADDEAVAAYRGPFLDGFYLRAADEFGRWVEDERARLGAAYAAALERFADNAAQRNDWPSAVETWRCLVALDRLSARNVLGLIRALAAAGDRPGALRTAATYESLVQQELGIPIEPSIAAFVRALRNGNGGPNGDLQQHGSTMGVPASPPDFTLAPSSEGPPPSNASVRGIERSRRSRVAAWLGLSVAGVAAIIWAASVLRRPTPPPGAGQQRVVVPPFENRTGDPSADTIGIWAADYTRTALKQTGLFEVLDPAFDFWQVDNAQPAHRSSTAALLRQTGATIIVRVWYYADGDSLSFSGQGIETKTGRVLFAFDSVKVGREKRLDALERVRQHVMSALATSVDSALTPWAGGKGKPPIRIDAYREFAQGMTYFVSAVIDPAKRAGRPGLFTAASAHLEQAVRLDSTYYIAALWLFWSRYNAGDQSGADSVVNALKRRRASMSRYEGVLYDYNDRVMHGTPSERYELDKQLVHFAPASEFNFCLARDALEANHPRETLDVLARLDSSYSWMRFMPPPPGFRVRALVQLRRYKEAVEAARWVHDHSPNDLTSAYPEIDALAALGRVDEIEQVVKRYLGTNAANSPMSANLMLYAGLWLRLEGRVARAHALFERALDEYSNEQASGIASEVIRFGLARSLYYLERWGEAQTAFEQLVGPPSNSSPNSRRALVFLGSLAARRGDSPEVSRIRGLLQRSSVNPAILQYFEARVAAVLGDNESALKLLSDAVQKGAQAEELVTQGDAAASMDPDFAALRSSPAFRTALGRW
jgi:DNA-binding SARP family transcriptional activator